MSDLDRYDVEAMIRDATCRLATRDDLHYTGQDARDGIAELRCQLDALAEQLDALRRTLDSRTAHLV